MKVKIFQTSAFDKSRDIEREINEWLAGSAVQIQRTNTAMGQVTDGPISGEREQQFVVTVWYENG